MFLLVAIVLLPACGRQRSYSNENDKLRAQNLKLEQMQDELLVKLKQREEELKAMRVQVNNGAAPIDGAEPPRLAGILLGRYSGPIDLDGDAVNDGLRIYVRPIDQHSRQVSAAGSARVRLVVTLADAEPTTLVDQRYSAEEFHDAYRDGITGTHYTLAADLPKDLPAKATLYVSLKDAATGRVFTAEKPVVLVRGSETDETVESDE